MSASSPETQKTIIRPLQHRDIETIRGMASFESTDEPQGVSVSFEQHLEQLSRWYGLLKLLSLFPNPFQHHLWAYVAQKSSNNSTHSKIKGFIQVSPFNVGRSTWRVDQILVNTMDLEPESLSEPTGVASQLLRYCFESIWEARTWLLEVNIHQKDALALYRQNGFQPLAEMTYWSLSPQLLNQLAQQETDLPNLLPVSNADAHLLYQLDCVSMPPLLRQVFDRHTQDFKSNLVNALISKVKQWCGDAEVSRGYVFEPQRKAAIGYFELVLSKGGNSPHKAKLTVHPAYTWLYPNLLARMAQIVQKYPAIPLELISADYQHERQEYLDQLGARRVEHTLLMSRSVWHKLKEIKPEGLQLSEVLQGLQPAKRQPIPSPWLKMTSQPQPTQPPKNGDTVKEIGENDHGKQDGYQS